MIASQDRSGWFGASDVSFIIGNWKTKSFQKWWLTKLGLTQGHYSSAAMNAGTYFEHAILDAVRAPRKDYQILLPELSLRVNLDGDDTGRIFEVKTHGIDKPYKPTKAHVHQVRVQMYAKSMEEGVLPTAEIVSYGLTEDDYKNFFRDIDPERIKHHPVMYSSDFIDVEFLPKLRYLKACLEKGVFPDEIPH